MNFLDRLKGGKKNQQGGGGGGKNPFGNVGKALGGGNKFHGAGQSLGGGKPGRVFQVELPHPGPLGMRIEKRLNGEGSAIVSMVVEGSQAETAGLKRGDILCYGGTNGEAEINYQQFLQLANSKDRPLVLDIRRIDTKSAPSTAGNSAEAYARKQAVIAAAEAREKAHKAKEKPIPKVVKKSDNNNNNNIPDQEFNTMPMSEEARRAVQAAKSGESQLAAQLGYNPYETSKATAGQARNATVAVTHGGMKGDGSVPPPKEPTTAAIEDTTPPVSAYFHEAFETLVTSSSHQVVVGSIGIMRKLIVNATTKGQNPAPEAAKFRKVRLTNAKIKAAITDVLGALEVMMSTGFQLTEENGESFLVYPPAHKGPEWLPRALQQMERYEKS